MDTSPQAPLSMGFIRQKYWRGLLFPSLGDLPNPGTAPPSPVSPALAGSFFTTEPSEKPETLLSLQLIFCPLLRQDHPEYCIQYPVNYIF